MASEWYYKTATNEELGPFSSTDLKRLASEGRIDVFTMVRKGTHGRWVAASNVKGLVNGEVVRQKAIVRAPTVRPTPGVRVSSKLDEGPEVPPPRVPRSPLKAGPSDADFIEIPSKRGYSPALLVGVGVGATLLAGGLVALGVMLAGRNSPPVTVAADRPHAAANTTPLKEAPSTATPTPFSSPEAVVKAYLAAKNWEERLPFVLNAAEMRPRMAQFYWNAHFNSDEFLPGSVISVEGRKEAVGDKCVVTIDVGASNPNEPRLSYAVVRSEERFKVNWTESQTLIKKVKQTSLRDALGNPELAVEVLRWRQSYSSADYEFRFTNKSKSLLTYVEFTMDVLDSKGKFIGNGYTNETNVRSDEPYVKVIPFSNVKVGEIAAWKLSLKAVSVGERHGAWEDATTLFKLNETLGGADRSNHKRLEDCLHGHWRESRLNSPFKSPGDFFFSSTTPEAIRVEDDGIGVKYSLDVIERNYSSGVLKLRLISAVDGIQLDMTPMDEKTIRTQLTEVSRGGESFREVETRSANDWTYIDAKERP